MLTRFRIPLAAAAALGLAACDSDTILVGGGGDPGEPRDLSARYEWVLEGFSGATAVGHPAVRLTWLPPADWSDETFRVYGRRAGGSGSFVRIATVTSCTPSGCVYLDRDVRPSETYEYFVSAYDERSGGETDTRFRETVAVPASTRPAAPRADSAIALDGALYLRWSPQGATGGLWKHQVYLTRVDGQETLYQAGETDGTGYLDERAENGSVYAYRVAAVDTLGHVSDLSGEITGIPRPDARGELVYAHADSAQRSGFRFRETEAVDPVLSGSAATAHWRLETTAGGWRIVPLNGTSVTEYGYTTALTCGPASDAACSAVTRAPAAGYQTTPIAVNPEFSYVFSVTGDDGRRHYGVVRAQILGSDAQGRDLMIFDWAYQTLPDEPRLTRSGG